MEEILVTAKNESGCFTAPTSCSLPQAYKQWNDSPQNFVNRTMQAMNARHANLAIVGGSMLIGGGWMLIPKATRLLIIESGYGLVGASDPIAVEAAWARYYIFEQRAIMAAEARSKVPKIAAQLVQ